jgi:hypothetical protein
MVLRWFILVVALGGMLLGILYWHDLAAENTRVVKHQVSKVASSDDNFLLPIFPHVKEISRPIEHYTFPIKLGAVGPVQSLYSGPNQYPFYCMTLDSKLGPPLVDNHQGLGVPVYDNNDDLLGFSKDCSLPSQLRYYLVDKQGQIKVISQEKIKELNSDSFKQLLRVEVGTINRFIYSLIMPITLDEVGQRTANSLWNNKLIYQFEGGSGIGYRQGRVKLERKIEKRLEQLKLGYAVLSSTGNRTSYTYNMLLAEDTMRRGKLHFVSLYGQPEYTVGVGGSGGGLAQYLIAQNAPGLLDAIIPQYSYPDMLSTATYALDCDLLNNYYTFRAGQYKRWQNLSERKLVEGMNSLDNAEQRAGFLQPVNQLMAGIMPVIPEGNSECINGWFGLSSFVHNPKQGFLRPIYSDDVISEVHWSYWQDNVWLFGHDKHGFAHTTWDNQGVQYGLNALNNGQLSVAEFLHLNRYIGGWKKQSEMAEEKIILPLGRKKPLWLSLWGTHNIYPFSEQTGSAKRQDASLEAIEAAYRGGQVYLGYGDIPIVDMRHYLEDELDMHHVSASFSSRARIKARQGQSEHHVIWVANKDFNPEVEAFAVIDKWLANIKVSPELSIAQAKPKQAVDTCFNQDGQVIASGNGVWDGRWNQKKAGQCSLHFPYYSNSRIEAGDPWTNSVFKCYLIPVSKAIAKGIYQVDDLENYQDELEIIFPDGVCDYQQGDLGLPDDLSALVSD